MATNVNMALGIHEGLFCFHVCMTSLERLKMQDMTKQTMNSQRSDFTEPGNGRPNRRGGKCKTWQWRSKSSNAKVL